MYRIVYTRKASKDIPKLKQAKLSKTVQNLIQIMKINPWETPPHFEKLSGDLKGLYARRINFQHRLVYQIYSSEKIIKIIHMGSHYE